MDIDEYIRLDSNDFLVFTPPENGGAHWTGVTFSDNIFRNEWPQFFATLRDYEQALSRDEQVRRRELFTKKKQADAYRSQLYVWLREKIEMGQAHIYLRERDARTLLRVEDLTENVPSAIREKFAQCEKDEQRWRDLQWGIVVGLWMQKGICTFSVSHHTGEQWETAIPAIVREEGK